MFYGELESLRQKGVLETDTHVSYGKDFHSSIYINSDLLFINPQLYKRFATKLANHYLDTNIQVVIGIGNRNAALAQIVSTILSELENRVVTCIFAQSHLNTNQFKSDFASYITSKRVLIVKDYLASVKSIDPLYCAIRELKGNMTGIGTIFSGDLVDVYFNMCLVHSVFDLHDFIHKAKSCPLCQKDISIKHDLED